jgi:U32 family peptidase
MMTAKDYEILLPVGTKEMAMAAIHGGANAIYLGVPGFNARGRTKDFSIEEAKEIIDLCHLYGVKVNLALNIVIFQNEISEVLHLLEQIIPLKPDAFIVQDLGLARLIRKLAPHQPLHASTQMTITNYEAIHLLEDLNFRRFVLGRENSTSEIESIRAHTQKDLEVFVHGALCVSYSGQCFTSESIGGRSANRGQCAQSCRFSYDLIVDGEKKNQVDRDYLVSPKDLCGIDHIPELMKIGVNSFKIEGRLKTPEYVFSAARSYRAVVDGTLADLRLDTQALKEQMQIAYSRGFYPGWLKGVEHQKLVDGTFSSHRGLFVGHIDDIDRGELILLLDEQITYNLENGDGLLWTYSDGKDQKEQGSFVYSVNKLGQRKLRIGIDGKVNLSQAIIGARVYINHSRSLSRDVELTTTDKSLVRRVPLDILIEAKIGSPLRVEVSDGFNKVVAQTASLIDSAKNKAVVKENIIDELGSLTGTVFELNSASFKELDENIFISHKEIKELRRQFSLELAAIRSSARIDRIETTIETANSVEHWVAAQKVSQQAATQLRLNILLRNREQAESLVEFLKTGVNTNAIQFVILDFEFGRHYEDSLSLLRKAGVKVALATTRILKPSEYSNLKAISRLAPDAILVRNLGALRYFTEVEKFPGDLLGDFSLNVTNHLTANYLLGKGLSSVCLSYDMNQSQLEGLLEAGDASRFEVTAHQYMPSFHMEHCVFAAFLSKGSSWRDCGKPCEKHKVELQDEFGNRHHIKPDHECRNTMYNAVAQSASSYIMKWNQMGLGSVRFEALNETGAELIDKISGYLKYMNNEISLVELKSVLGQKEKYGLSEGSLSRQNEYQSRKKNF